MVGLGAPSTSDSHLPPAVDGLVRPGLPSTSISHPSRTVDGTLGPDLPSTSDSYLPQTVRGSVDWLKRRSEIWMSFWSKARVERPQEGPDVADTLNN